MRWLAGLAVRSCVLALSGLCLGVWFRGACTVVRGCAAEGWVGGRLPGGCIWFSDCEVEAFGV